MRNKCALCGSNEKLQIFHNDYICSKCISALKTLMKNKVFDSDCIQENPEGMIDINTYHYPHEHI